MFRRRLSSSSWRVSRIPHAVLRQVIESPRRSARSQRARPPGGWCRADWSRSCEGGCSLRSLSATGGEGTGRHHAEPAVWAQGVVLVDPGADRDRASVRLSNSSPLRSSSRLVPLKRSTKGFCCGDPFSMKAVVTPCSASQSKSVAAMNSRPLSERSTCGLPCRSKSRSRSWTTSLAPIERSTRQPNATRVYSSTTFRIRSERHRGCGCS
jgi:hypothetical protein